MNILGRRIVAAGAVALVVFSVTACSATTTHTPSSQAEAGNSQTPIAGSTSTSMPTPTPPRTSSPPVDLADPARWTITFSGIGPLTVGVDIAAAYAVLPTFVDTSDLQSCPVRFLHGADGPALALVPDAAGLVHQLVLEGATWGIPADVAARNTPKTAAGIGASATLAQLLDAYPGIAKTGTYSDEDYYAITDGAGRWIVFSVTTGTAIVGSIQVGDMPTDPKEYCG